MGAVCSHLRHARTLSPLRPLPSVIMFYAPPHEIVNHGESIKLPEEMHLLIMSRLLRRFPPAGPKISNLFTVADL